MEDIDEGLHPTVDGQSLDEDEESESKLTKEIHIPLTSIPKEDTLPR